jgi:hypothetical protein
MRASVRATAWLGVLILLVGCARVDRPAPTVAATVSPAPSTAPEPTPVMTPSVAPSATLVAAGDAPQVDCAGGMMSGADIDYVPEAQGVDDILAATRNLIGVRATDVIVAEPTVTVVVRDGRPIWRGEWRDGGRGFLLDSRLACTDTGIR